MTIEEIDKQIDAVHYKLRSLEKFNRMSAEAWQRAWDRHPDLREQETLLYRLRGLAQIQRYC